MEFVKISLDGLSFLGGSSPFIDWNATWLPFLSSLFEIDILKVFKEPKSNFNDSMS